jgi:hypothetical protein
VNDAREAEDKRSATGLGACKWKLDCSCNSDWLGLNMHCTRVAILQSTAPGVKQHQASASSNCLPEEVLCSFTGRTCATFENA